MLLLHHEKDTHPSFLQDDEEEAFPKHNYPVPLVHSSLEGSHKAYDTYYKVGVDRRIHQREMIVVDEPMVEVHSYLMEDRSLAGNVDT